MKPVSYTILIDRREQTPLRWDDCPVELTTLKTADYSIIWDGVDLRDVVTIERKSTSDMLGCIGTHRASFQRELSRMAMIPFRALVIEGTLRDLFDNRFSVIHPNAVLGSLMAWTWRYGVPPIFVGDRQLAAAATRALLVHGARANVHRQKRRPKLGSSHEIPDTVLRCL